MTTEEQVWLDATQKVLQEAKTPLHYLDIKRAILEKALVGPGLQTTLESVLFKDANRPNARIKLVNSQGMFTLMTDQERAANQLKFLSAASTKGTPPRGVAQSDQTSSSDQLLQRGKVKVIKIKRGPGRPRMHERAQPNGHINPVVNDKYRKKWIKLKKFAKKMLFINAAVCDEVSRVEDKLTRARAERRFLVKKLLNHQAVSEALCQMVAKQPQSAAMLGQSLGPAALSKLPVGIAGPLSMEMNQEATSSPENKSKSKKKSASSTKKKTKQETPSEEKPKQKKKTSAKNSPLGTSGQVVLATAGDPGSGSLRHLLTTKTVMEPP